MQSNIDGPTQILLVVTTSAEVRNNSGCVDFSFNGACIKGHYCFDGGVFLALWDNCCRWLAGLTCTRGRRANKQEQGGQYKQTVDHTKEHQQCIQGKVVQNDELGFSS